MSKSLTAHLLSTNREQFTRATQTPFLKEAASGTLSKNVISHWLANDRLYMQGYIKLTGELLRILQLPAAPAPIQSNDSPTTSKLVDWLIDALVNIRREEKFFLDVAKQYDLNIDLTDASGSVMQEKRISGLDKFDALFYSLTSSREHDEFLPWLEGAVVFWATEIVYFTAWSWARDRAGEVKDARRDEDGGAMRKEFIPNWTNDEFKEFVDALQRLVDDGVREAVGEDDEKWDVVRRRAERAWKDVLSAEEAFWPELS